MGLRMSFPSLEKLFFSARLALQDEFVEMLLECGELLKNPLKSALLKTIEIDIIQRTHGSASRLAENQGHLAKVTAGRERRKHGIPISRDDFDTTGTDKIHGVSLISSLENIIGGSQNDWLEMPDQFFHERLPCPLKDGDLLQHGLVGKNRDFEFQGRR